MFLNNKKLSTLSGLKLETRSAQFYGVKDGFPVTIRVLHRTGKRVLHLSCKLQEGADRSAALADWESWASGFTEISTPMLHDFSLEFEVYLRGSGREERAAEMIASATAHARQLGMIPCCAICGREGVFPQYYDGIGYTTERERSAPIIEGFAAARCDRCAAAREEEVAVWKKEAHPGIGYLLSRSWLFILIVLVLCILLRNLLPPGLFMLLAGIFAPIFVHRSMISDLPKTVPVYFEKNNRTRRSHKAFGSARKKALVLSCVVCLIAAGIAAVIACTEAYILMNPEHPGFFTCMTRLPEVLQETKYAGIRQDLIERVGGAGEIMLFLLVIVFYGTFLEEQPNARTRCTFRKLNESAE